MHGCPKGNLNTGAAWLSSARVVRCWVLLGEPELEEEPLQLVVLSLEEPARLVAVHVLVFVGNTLQLPFPFIGPREAAEDIVPKCDLRGRNAKRRHDAAPFADHDVDAALAFSH